LPNGDTKGGQTLAQSVAERSLFRNLVGGRGERKETNMSSTTFVAFEPKAAG
jgi:hypothetical protein